MKACDMYSKNFGWNLFEILYKIQNSETVEN